MWFIKKRWLILAFLVCLPLDGYPAENKSISLTNLVNEVINSNRDLAALKEHINAISTLPDQAGSLPNPSLTVGLVNIPTDSFDLKQEAMTQKTIGLMQKFPYPGKRGLKREIAQKQLEKSLTDLETLKLQLVRDLKIDYYTLYFVSRSREVTQRNKRLLQDFIRIAETKYSVGKGIQQDVLKAYVELSKMNEKLISLEEKEAVLKARLNYYMNREPDSPFEMPQELELSHGTMSDMELMKGSFEKHPLLKGMKSLIKKGDKARLLAEKNYYPDFNVTLQYGQREDGNMDRADFISTMVSVQLPIWQKNKEDKKLMEKRARLNETRLRYESARNRLAFMVKKTKSEMESAWEKTLLFRDGIIPQAKASLESAIAGYQVNKVDFLTLLNNHLTLFNYEIQYYRSLTDHEIKMAELEEALGGSFMAPNNGEME
ncbi:MAG: TolC family protein [Deltaproteobacteria bacterium]|nr:TolC family protein [Deltaproteobacteria bacterium]